MTDALQEGKNRITNFRIVEDRGGSHQKKNDRGKKKKSQKSKIIPEKGKVLTSTKRFVKELKLENKRGAS